MGARATALVASRLAAVDDTGTGEPQAITGDDTARRKEMAERLMAAFVEHARTRLGLAADADATTVIAAFFAAHAKPGADAPARWMENDSGLMLCLAKACKLFADEPEAADLGPGHRRLLANGLALALTSTIDWSMTLKADTAGGAAVFYDGLSLRNATGLSIKDATAAIDARIGQALAACATTRGLAAIIPQLRAALVNDPTLSFEPLSQSVRYGSRDWVNLWIGIQACAATGMDPVSMTAAEVTAYGQAIEIGAARQNQADAAREAAPPGQAQAPQAASPLPSQTGLLLMAHAAGKVDLTELRETNQAEITEKVQAFAAEEFKTELALGEVLERLLALNPPPTARSIAEDVLKEKGLDPEAIVIEEPISSKGRRESYKLHEFYVKFNDLSEIESSRFNRALIEKVGDNNPLYKDIYGSKFDAYISDYIGAHQKIVGLVLDVARKDGFKPDDDGSFVRVHRPRILSHPDIQAHGFFISCADGQNLYRYFLSPAGTIERIPAEASTSDWLIQNRHAALTQEDLDKIRLASGADVNFSSVLEPEFSGATSRIGDVIDAHFRPSLLELKKQNKPVQDGVSKADRVLEMAVPFYGTYTGLKRGDYVTAYLSFVAGVFVLIPTAFAARKLVAVSKQALAGGIKIAVASFSQHGPIKGTMLGLKHASTHLPSMGMHAMHTAGTLLDALMPVPAGTRSFGELFSRPFRNLKPATLQETATSLGGRFPSLASKLRTHIAPPPPSRMKFTLFSRKGARPSGMPEAPGLPGVDGVAGAPAIGNARRPFVKAVDGDGGTRWLRRFGNAYAEFDPHRLNPVGPVLVRGRNGALTPSLTVNELAHHAVSDPATLSLLRRTRLSADGTVAVNGRTYAPIAGTYVEVVPRTPTRAGEPPTWHAAPATAHAASDAAGDVPTLLTYSPGQGGWIDLAHRVHGVEVPIDILERYQVANASLREALAQAQVSADGTILHGAKRYAQVNGRYVELVADHAATTPEQPVWRIAGAPLSGTRNGAPRLAWDKEARIWREPEHIPALRGGGGVHGTPAGVDIRPVKRIVVNDDATNAMGNSAVMDPSEGPLRPRRLKLTETVSASEKVLQETTDLTHYPWWKEEFDEYMDIVVLNLETSAYAKVDTSLADPANADRMRTSIENDMRTFLTDLYTRSETFRGLVNNAKAKGILRKDHAWVIQISLPSTLKNGKATIADAPHILGAPIFGAPYSGAKKIVVPDVKSPPFMSLGTIENREGQLLTGMHVDGGKHVPHRTPSTIVHEFMHFLTRKHDPIGTGDRGVVEYLAQRIVKEAGIVEPRRLAYSTRISGDKVYKYTEDEINRLHKYVDAQDKYLATRFPMPDPPAEPWNPSKGNDRWLKADTSQLTDSGSPS